MKKIVIEFDPNDISYYVNGPKFHTVLFRFNQRLRSRLKYEDEGPGNDHDTVDALREELYEIWEDEIYQGIEDI